MCLGIACEVIEVEDRDSCLLRVGTGVQRCFTGLVDPVAPGDWLLMHAGFAVQRITPEEAAANLALIRRAALLQEDALRPSDAGPDADSYADAHTDSDAGPELGPDAGAAGGDPRGNV